ncbi:Tubulin-folding cofactor D [Meyerozyma sp. JA9]|nr:Tubulin-folding cofactor D [Meyerozyma sp. JA9]
MDIDLSYVDGISRRKDHLHAEITSLLSQLLSIENASTSHLNAIVVKLNSRIDEFETSPSLLDSKLNDHIKAIAEKFLIVGKKPHGNTFTRAIASVVYCFAKVRGYKIVTNCFPSDVYLLNDLYLRYSDEGNDENEIFMLSLWLSNTVLAPFPLEKVQPDIIFKLISSATKKLCSSYASKSQIGASVLLSRIVTRPDSFRNGTLSQFYENNILPTWSMGSDNETQKLGYSMVLNKVLKLATLESGQYLSNLVFRDILLLDSMYLDITRPSGLRLLYFVKLSTRIADSFLACGRYQDVSKVITILVQQMMDSSSSFDTKLRYSTAKALALISRSLSRRAVNYHDQLIQFLFKQFTTHSSIQIDGQNFTRTFEVDDAVTSIHRIHTLLLFFGFVAMNKSLPIHTVPSVLSVVHKYLFFESYSGSSELGVSVRDASCFVLWAIIRLLTPDLAEELETNNSQMFLTIFQDVLKVSIFDRDLIIRRCGISVIQELIGRHGRLCLDQSDSERLGETSIRIIELMTFRAISESQKTFVLVEELLKLGICSDELCSPILKNILDQDVDFKLQKRCIRTLISVLDNDNLPQGIISKFLENLLHMCNDHSDHIHYSIVALAFKSESARRFILESGRSFHSKLSGNLQVITAIKAETYILYLVLCKTLGIDFDSSRAWHDLSVITMSVDSDDLDTLLQQYLHLCETLSDQHYDAALELIERGDKAFAKSISSVKCSRHQSERLVNLLHNDKLPCAMKALILDSFLLRFPLHKDDHSTLLGIIKCLDNYTRTEQGDVGSEVRYSTIQLIQVHRPVFEPLASELNKRLVRISGEQIDRLRVKAFELMVGEKEEFDSSLTYFTRLFEYYRSVVLEKYESTLSVPFWRGIVFSAAAIRGPSDVINASFREMLVFFRKLTPDRLWSVFQSILQILLVPKDMPLHHQSSRAINTYTNTLNLFVKLFESGFRFPSGFDYQRLYIRSYNLHINTSNVTRIRSVLRIFLFLSMPEYGSMRDARKRLCWVACKHSNTYIRNSAAHCLYELALQLGAKFDTLHLLESCEWNDVEKSSLQLKIVEPLFINL